jgi:hypothetical protein
LPFQKVTAKLLMFLLKLFDGLKQLSTVSEPILYFEYYFISILIIKMANAECFKNVHFHWF